MSAKGEPAAGPSGGLRVRFVLGVAAPLAVVALAYALWWISDRLGSIGPLDRSVFGWAVVIPAWVAAPVAAGFAWRRLTPLGRLVAAAVVAIAIGGAAAWLFWQAVSYPDCELPIHAPGDWVLPSLILGGVIGGGLAASALLASKLVRDGRPWRGVMLGAGAEVIMVFVAILVAGAMLLGPGCQRPPI
jgi:hypothetical protein